MMQLLTRHVAQDKWEDLYGGAQEEEAVGCASSLGEKAGEGRSSLTTGMGRQPRLLLLDTILSADRVLMLRERVKAHLYWEDGLWTCELANLRIMGYGETQERAIAAFFEDFIATYDGLVYEDDSSLTRDARLAKQAIRQLVRATPTWGIARGFVGRH
jgi:hypothetical protein